MATQGNKAMGPFKQRLQSSAGSSQDGGGGGATPPPSPRSQPRSSPPHDEDEYLEKEQTKQERSGFRCLFMSVEQNIPSHIDRQNSEPLSKRKYFSLHNKWLQLLAGKRTYLRSPKNTRVPECNRTSDGFLFQNPEPPLRAIGCQEPLLVLIQESTENSIIQQKFKILSQHYVLFRRVRIDGSCFYRAFLFSYLEKLNQMQDCQAEITRLMECLEVSRDNFCQLKWDKAYFLNPEAYFSSVVSDFKHLVKAAANGLSTDELYKISLQEIRSSRILSFLRLLTEIEIRTHEEAYKSLFPRQIKAHWCCMKAVRPMHIEATKLQMRALSYTLGIPLRLEIVDQLLKEGAVQARRVDFFPRSESRVSTASGSLDSVESYYSSSTAEKPPNQGRDSDSVRQTGVSTHDNLVSSCGMPSMTLLCRLSQCDILYHK